MYINPGQTIVRLAPPDVAPAPAGRSTFRIPVGPTYDELLFTFTDAGGGRTAAEIAADIDRVRVTVGSRVKMDLTGAQFTYLAATYGTRLTGASPVSPGNDGTCPLYLSRPWMAPVAPVAGEPNFSNVDGPAYGTLGESSFTVEIFWNAASGCTGCVVTSLQRPGTPLGSHITILPIRRTLAGAGTDIISQDFPIEGMTSAYVAIHVGDANVTQIEWIVDRTTFRNLTIDEMNSINRKAGRAPDANFAMLDFVNRNRFSDALVESMASLEARITFGVGPGDYDILLERVETSEMRPVQRT